MCVKKLEFALNELEGYHEYLVLPAYIEYSMKQRRGIDFDPYEIFKKVSGEVLKAVVDYQN